MERDYNLDHISLPNGEDEVYVTSGGWGDKDYPSRDRERHAEKLKAELEEVIDEFESQVEKYENREAGLVTLEGKEGYNLKSKSAADKRTESEILKKEEDTETKKAVVRITESGFESVSKKMEQYKTEETTSDKPRNKDFVESIEKIKTTILEELWMGEEDEWPNNEQEQKWWELWLIGGEIDEDKSKEYKEKFGQSASKIDIFYEKDYFIEFSERQIVLIEASINQLRELITHIDLIAEIHPPSRPAIQKLINENEITDISNIKGQISFSEDGSNRITIMDTGVADGHPLLEPAIAEDGLHTVDTDSDLTSDYRGRYGHGTSVAGLATFGDIAELIEKDFSIEIKHKIESVRIPLDEDGSKRHLWPQMTEEAVNVVENENPDINRVFNLCITGEKSFDAKPTSWSSTIDKLCYNEGEGRLITVSAGNIAQENIDSTYPNNNLVAQIDNPAHAINAICVGGYTSYVTPIPSWDEYEVLADEGELSPHTRSGKVKEAIKPDVVCEAGNVMVDSIEISATEFTGLSLVSTSKDIYNKPLINFCGTSAAAPKASKMLSRIWAENPEYSAATIRGLLIHSANWTDAMKEQFENRYDLYRTCGYGVPDVQSAIKSANSHATLIAEDEITCNYEEGQSEERYLNYYEIPWPKDLLLTLGEKEVELKVTLSYFSEPNPRQTARNYQGAKLKWGMQNPNETDEEFFRRINYKHREEGERGHRDDIPWELGVNARSRGTVQSDKWNCIASELATCGHIIVYPVNGWWKDRKDKRKNAKLNFSLIISVKTEDVGVDLYNPIEEQITQEITPEAQKVSIST